MGGQWPDYKKRAYRKIYNANNKEKFKGYWLKRKYGLTIEAYNDLIKGQKGRCALCRKKLDTTKKLVVDHCHKTGKVRGILHSKCNNLLGMADDSVKNLEKAIAYLRRP